MRKFAAASNALSTCTSAFVTCPKVSGSTPTSLVRAGAGQVRVFTPSVAEIYHSTTARFACAGMLASTSPSPFVSVIVSVANVPPSSRQCSVADVMGASSSKLHDTTIGSVDFGTMGRCFVSLISGATFAETTEFAAPGEPPTAALKPQFCPLPMPSAGFRSSSVFPPSVASLNQDQPLCDSDNTPRPRSAHSPSSA